MITLENVTKIYEDNGAVALRDVSLKIGKGEFVFVVGSSGSGKSTLVFQDFRLLPSKTVYENVAFAMQIVEASPKMIRRTVPQVLSLVGLGKKGKAYPNQLSGGEQQRVALARAIVNKPPIQLADEPTGNLDPDTAWEIMELLENINANGTTVVMATHAKDIVDRMKKRVVTMDKGIVLRDVMEGGYDDEA